MSDVTLAGLTSVQIAEKVTSGEITVKDAERFVADRAKKKLHKHLDA